MRQAQVRVKAERHRHRRLVPGDERRAHGQRAGADAGAHHDAMRVREELEQLGVRSEVQLRAEHRARRREHVPVGSEEPVDREAVLVARDQRRVRQLGRQAVRPRMQQRDAALAEQLRPAVAQRRGEQAVRGHERRLQLAERRAQAQDRQHGGAHAGPSRRPGGRYGRNATAGHRTAAP